MGDSSGSRNVLLLAVVVAILLVAVLFLVLGSNRESDVSDRDPRAAMEQRDMPLARRIAKPAAGSAEQDPDRPVAEATPSSGVRAPIAQLIAEVRTRFRESIRDCEVEPASPEERITLRFRVRVKDGALDVHDAKTLDSTISDEALQDCIVSSLLGVGWMVGGSDVDKLVDEPVVLRELMEAKGMAIPSADEHPPPERKPSPAPPRPQDRPPN